LIRLGSGVQLSQQAPIGECELSKNIKIFKFVSSEEVIAEVEGQSRFASYSVRYTIKNCIQVILQSGPNGFGAILVPWGSVEGLIEVDSNHILFVGDPKKDLLEQYEKVFSPLALPPKTLLVG